MQEINQILDFIVEIEKLKAVLRKTWPVGYIPVIIQDAKYSEQ